jgi:hypothetical protein
VRDLNKKFSYARQKTVAGFSRNAKNIQQRQIQFHPKSQENVQVDQNVSVHLMITAQKNSQKD